MQDVAWTNSFSQLKPAPVFRPVDSCVITRADKRRKERDKWKRGRNRLRLARIPIVNSTLIRAVPASLLQKQGNYRSNPFAIFRFGNSKPETQSSKRFPRNSNQFQPFRGYTLSVPPRIPPHSNSSSFKTGRPVLPS